MQIINHPSTHYSSRGGAKINSIILHHTAGTDSLKYLTKNSKGVSTGSLINKPGTIYRMVPPELAAHTVGFSNLGVFLSGTKRSPNLVTYNIELENLGDGKDPYPDTQRDACGYEIAWIWKQYGVVPVLTHEIIDTQGKTDPRGLDLADVLRRALNWYKQAYSEGSPIMGIAPAIDPESIAAQIVSPHYSPARVFDIIDEYWRVASLVGVDPLVAVAQMCHETGSLASFWSAPPQNNPAGIGVTGEWSSTSLPGYTYNTERKRYEKGISFADWLDESIPAHVGRLLAYATRPEERNKTQQACVDYALTYRGLPANMHGSAPTLKQLGKAHNPTGGGWASPGVDYGAKIAAKANWLVEG